jgi:hypothetical protein
MRGRIFLPRLLTRRERLRRRIWHLMENAGVLTFPLDTFGRVPNFIGSEKAAELLAEQPEFEQAKVIFVSPDHVLRRVRELVLERGKVLAVSLPQRLIRQNNPALLQITERRAIKAEQILTTSFATVNHFHRPLTLQSFQASSLTGGGTDSRRGVSLVTESGKCSLTTVSSTRGRKSLPLPIHFNSPMT